MINYQLQKLKNGLTVITAPMKETKAVTILVLVKVGSRYEPENLSGISHFLEHMFFKGTKNRPTSLDISQELDEIGANYNAFTSEEYTGFYISSAADKFDISLDIISDILLNSKFNAEEIKKERGVILEEINMYKDIPQKYVQDLAKELLYGDTSLGRSVLGKVKTVKKIKRKDFINYFQKNYEAKDTIVVVAGNQSKFDWQNNINKAFNKLTKGKTNKPLKQVENQKTPKILLHYKKTDQAHLVLNYRTFSRFNSQRYQLKIFNNLFGGIMSSRLFTEIREKRGLAYYIGSSLWEFDDVGTIFVSAGLDKKRIDEAIKVILDEFEKIKKDGVCEKELQKSKENIKGRFYLALEDSFSIAEFLAEQRLLFNNIRKPDEIIKDFFAVKKEDIQKLANKYFIPRNLNLTIIGPYCDRDKQRFEKLLNI